ncbi:guanylate kinase [Hypoxylon trugodes]|uniref:guanylate kinase n=1 Tax=Hypoxylon trugodes TaxID=326681 RepID=UPI0021A16097|nr:guanylate kinase [Hypoxylon trugodes]KAI1392024.1 guanylate kinase [Hypoxylon trugodes]
MAPTPPQDRRPIVISGPSGVGKGTPIQKLFHAHPDTFTTTISHTTRKPRVGEVDGTIADQTAKGLVIVLDIDVQGVKQVKASPDIDARYVFIKPPSFEKLEARLRSRGTEREEDVLKRLVRAKVELKYANTLDIFDIIVVNDDLEWAYRELEEYVFR